MIRLLLMACLLVASAVPLLAERTWTDRTGKFKVKAELVTVENGTAELKRADGKISKVPIDRLSTADLRHLATLAKYREQVMPLLHEDDPFGVEQETPAKTAESPVAMDTTPRPMATISVQERAATAAIRQFESPSWGYRGLAFSSNGAHLVALGNSDITVFDVDASQRVVYPIDSGDTGHLSSVSFSPDGKQLLVGSYKGTALIWDVDEQCVLSPKHQFSVHRGEIKSILASPDGKTALTTHAPNVACLWNVNTGDVIAQYNDFYFSSGGTGQFSRHGGQGLICDGKILALVDLSNNELLQAMRLSRGIGQSRAISPDGGYVAVNNSYDMLVWEIKTGKQLPTLQSKSISWSADFSPDGRRLLTGERGKVLSWDIQSGQRENVYEMGQSGYVKHVDFSPDGIHFAAIGGPIGKVIQVFRVAK